MPENRIWENVPKGRLSADVSLWSADLGALAAEVRRTEPFAGLFHLDVANAHFVPGLLFYDIVAIQPAVRV
jgi:ribulose-phosphate 3-epimerase